MNVSLLATTGIDQKAWSPFKLNWQLCARHIRLSTNYLYVKKLDKWNNVVNKFSSQYFKQAITTSSTTSCFLECFGWIKFLKNSLFLWTFHTHFTFVMNQKFNKGNSQVIFNGAWYWAHIHTAQSSTLAYLKNVEHRYDRIYQWHLKAKTSFPNTTDMNSSQFKITSEAEDSTITI